MRWENKKIKALLIVFPAIILLIMGLAPKVYRFLGTEMVLSAVIKDYSLEAMEKEAVEEGIELEPDLGIIYDISKIEIEKYGIDAEEFAKEARTGAFQDYYFNLEKRGSGTYDLKSVTKTPTEGIYIRGNIYNLLDEDGKYLDIYPPYGDVSEAKYAEAYIDLKGNIKADENKDGRFKDGQKINVRYYKLGNSLLYDRISIQETSGK